MGIIVYLLCTMTSAACAMLLLREDHRRSSRLLFWSGLSFAALAVSNALVFVDFVVWPSVDLTVARSAIFCASTGLLLYGLVWDGD
jgi:hypothetical protein